MTVFLSGETPAGFSLDPKRDLDGLEAREIEVIRVPGVTDTMMNEPHVGVLGTLLGAWLDATESQRDGDRSRPGGDGDAREARPIGRTGMQAMP